MSARFTIDPNTVYTEGAIALALDIPLAALAKARRTGALRYARRGRRVLILGHHLLAWLEPDPIPTASPGQARGVDRG